MEGATTTPEQEKSRPKRILVLDGGGMRGISTITILKHLQRDYNITLADFDLIAGTSAGGLIALSTLLGLTLDAMDDLFLKVGQEIFAKRSWGSNVADAIKHMWSGTIGTEAPGKYPLQDYEKVITGLLEESTNLHTQAMKELGASPTKPKVFAVSTDISFKHEIHPFLFRSYEFPHSDDPKTMYLAIPKGTSTTPLVKAAVATSAAPFYFDDNVPIEHHRVVDGGVGFNNPIILALNECMRLFGWDVEVGLVLSIGTGLPALDVVASQDKSSFDWARTIADMATNGDLIHRNFLLVRPLLSNVQRATYARFDPPHLGSLAMDDASEATVRKIRGLASGYMSDISAKRKATEIATKLGK